MLFGSYSTEKEVLTEIINYLILVTDDEYELTGALAAKCARVTFDDNIVNKQVTCVILL